MSDTEHTDFDNESLITEDMHAISEIVHYSSHVHSLFLSTCANLCNNADNEYEYKDIGKLVLNTFKKAARELIKNETTNNESDDEESDDDTFAGEVDQVVEYLTDNIVDFVQNRLDYMYNELKENKDYRDDDYIGQEIYCINSNYDNWESRSVLSKYSIHNQKYSSGNVRFRLDRANCNKDSTHLINIAIFIYYREYDEMIKMSQINFDEYKPVNVKNEINLLNYKKI